MQLPMKRWVILLALLICGLTPVGCASSKEESKSSVEVLEHTDSKPPPGILEKQQQQARAQAEVAGKLAKPGK